MFTLLLCDTTGTILSIAKGNFSSDKTSQVHYTFKMELILLVAGFALISSASAAEFCRTSYNYYTYCYDSCCGYYYNGYCCSNYLTVGAIVGIVIGCLIAGAVIISIIVCVACNACKRGSKGTVVAPVAANPAGIAVVSANVTTHGYQQGYQPGYQQYPVGMQPPPNQFQQTYPPPTQNVAYPPPPPPNYAVAGSAYPPTVTASESTKA